VRGKHYWLAGAGGCCWSGVREKHCWLVGGWGLLLEWCERKTLLAGAGAEQQNMINFIEGAPLYH